MADIFTKKKRSYIMSRVRSKWTKPERLAHNILKGNKIRHTMHPKMIGNPDVILKDKKVAIFLDGCFWHGCPRCYTTPASSASYWKKKIALNKTRDSKHRRILRKGGWNVISIWEHELDEKHGQKTNKALSAIISSQSQMFKHKSLIRS